jgi:hypothetical protein
MHEESKYGFSGKIPATFVPHIETALPLSDDEIRLYVAFCADGRIEYEATSYVRFHLKKQRKIDRLCALLTRLNIPFSFSEATKRGTRRIGFNCPFLKEKIFSKEWYKASVRQLSVVADECFLWDGRSDDRIFFSVDKESADFIQYACAVAYNVYTSLRIVEPRAYSKLVQYHVHPTKKQTVGMAGRATTPKGAIERIPPEDGHAYSFTVPSGMLVTRCDGSIICSAN